MFRLGLQIFQGLKPQALAKSIKHAQNYTCICSYPNLTKNFAPERNFQTTCDLYNAQEVKKKRDFYIATATSDYYCRITELLQKTFFIDEPVVKAAGLSGDVPKEFEDYVMSSLDEYTSFAAVADDSGKVLGVALNGTLLPDHSKKLLKNLINVTDQRLVKLYTLYAALEQAPCFWEKHCVDKIWEIRILATDPAHRGKGISKLLTQKSVELAQMMNFKMLRVDCTSQFSAKVAESVGLTLEYTLRYEDYLDKCKKPVFVTERPHTEAKVYVKMFC